MDACTILTILSADYPSTVMQRNADSLLSADVAVNLYSQIERFWKPNREALRKGHEPIPSIWI